MRYLIIGINYYPELTGIGKFSGEMGEYLAANGHEVTVVTAPPYYPAWKVADGYRRYWYERERHAGVDIIRCPLWVPSRPSGLKRILHLLSFAVSSAIPALMIAARRRPDVVMVVEPPFMCTPTGLLAAFISRGRSWLHIQDFEIDAAFDLGLIRSPFLRKVAYGMERVILARFDRVSTISDRMMERLSGKGVPAERQAYFPNWVDTDQIRPLDREGNDFRASLGLDGDRILLLYSGNMGGKQGLEVIIEAASRLRADGRFFFLLCGEGAFRDTLERQAGELPNVRFINLQPFEKLNELLNSADIHLLPQREDAEDLVMPSKLTAMLASGRPVIATATEKSQVGQVVGKTGMLVPAGDVEALVRAIEKLASSGELRERLGAAGRRYAVEHWGKIGVLGKTFAE